ncbi:MAG: cysteine synthase family protein [Bacteroidales bacterium]|jgi:cysteine synthase A|nr:cysteine synthase family protein [Bacteroidales bacterium]
MNTQKTLGVLDKIIGHTPMVEIRYSYNGKEGSVFAKCEHYNFTGSIKDRMALYILKEAYRTGAINSEHEIWEATSGNTGIAFSALGRMLGHKVTIVMPDWMSIERKLMITSFGAEIVLVSKEQGGFLGSIKYADNMAAERGNIFLPHQFSNENNYKAHEETTGVEILHQLIKRGQKPDAFIAGVGTGGTVVGVGKALRKVFPNTKIHPLEPEESPTLSTGHKVGVHRIQGISDEFIPEIMKYEPMDEVISVSDGDSIIMARKLASQLGLAVGISSGGNFIGAVKLAERYGFDKTIVTVFADDNKKYLSTDLMKKEPVKDSYFAPNIQLLAIDPCERC